MFGGAATRTVQMKNLHRAPAELAGKYAIEDPDLAIDLWHWQEDEIKRQGIEQVCGLERRLTPVLVELERKGIRVDVGKARERSGILTARVRDLQTQLNEAAGKEVNPNSPKQMQALFGAWKEPESGNWFTKDGHPLPKTDSGGPSIDADALRLLALHIPEAAIIKRMRKLTKAQQFVDGHVLGHEVDGIVYPNYNQTRSESGLGTGTGRFSINDPAMQQIPARDVEIAAETRDLFIPNDGMVWCCADWNQKEFRWFAHYVNDAKLNMIYKNDAMADFHKMVAEQTGLPRSARFAGDANAKQINLGLVFGMGEGKMAAEMGLDYSIQYNQGKEYYVAGEKAKQVFKRYHEAIPGVRELLNKAASIGRSRGYVQTIFGRRIRFPKGKSPHAAAGLVFQGTSADCMKYKMIECHEAGHDIRLSVHDEADFYMKKKGAEKEAADVKQILETFDGESCPIKCRIPIRSSVVLGPNWWEACK